jgi:uncharacterized protein (TIGR03083 family)
MSDEQIPALYRGVRERITAFVRGLPDGADQTVVPACPAWTVHDVIAHLVGITDDAIAGRMQGVTTDPWTAAQVERGRGVPTAELLERWDRQGPMIEPGLVASPLAVVDAVTHEHDLYGALGRAVERDSAAVAFACRTIGAGSFEELRARLGRRSAAQMDALGIPRGAIVFGPREDDLVE